MTINILSETEQHSATNSNNCLATRKAHYLLVEDNDSCNMNKKHLSRNLPNPANEEEAVNKDYCGNKIDILR